MADFARRAARALLGLPALLAATLRAWAEQPYDWQLGMQPAATPVRDHIDALHNELVVIITLITLFVMGLLLYVIVRFNAKRHPAPSRATHNTLLEVVWTMVPVLILVFIAVPSFKLLYFESANAHPQMTVKITGHQWYWSYEYPDQGDFSFDSNMLSDAQDQKDDKPRLLGVDNPMVVPVGTVVRVLVTSTDVIHSWFVPSAGVQEYAVPGRVNEAWFKFERPGVYYGQCNQICGINHPFMPIEVRAVSAADFAKWTADAKKRYSSNDDGMLKLAADASR
ncbi:MAG: cytochrome c oxidase subunit II [Alphaproteobacteria bacterium]|nr:cytochrome c oxidase subunit II [Alphaproteobacteria bacterium]